MTTEQFQILREDIRSTHDRLDKLNGRVYSHERQLAKHEERLVKIEGVADDVAALTTSHQAESKVRKLGFGILGMLIAVASIDGFSQIAQALVRWISH